MDPRTQQIMAEVLIGRGNRAAQGTNPYGAAFGGLAQILAQLNLGKATNALEKAAQDKEEQDRQNQAKALKGAGLSDDQIAALQAVDPNLRSQLMAQFMKAPKPEAAMDQFGAGDQMMLGSAEKQFHNLTPESQAAMVSALNGAGEFASGAALGAGGMASASPGQVGPPPPGFGLDPSQFQMAQKPPSGLEKLAAALANPGQSKTVEGKEPLRSKNTSESDNKVQQALRDTEEQLDRLDQIVPEYADEFLTSWGRGKSKAALIQDHLRLPIPESWQQKAEERVDAQTEMHNQVEQLFNVYRKLITGAAASVLELKMLRESFLNTDMSPTQFKSAYRVLRNTLERKKARFQEYLATGISLEDAQAKMRADFESERGEEFEGGEVPYFIDVASQARSEALGKMLAEGMSEDEDDPDPDGLFQ